MKDYSDNPIDIRLQNCTECGQEIDQDNDYYEYNAKDEIICDSCYSSHWESAVSVYEYDPEYENLSRIEYSYTLDKHRDYENYDPYDGPPQCIKSAGYKRIDGWRGYVDVEIADGFTCVAEGWTTGMYDDVKWKWDFNEFVNKVHEGNCATCGAVLHLRSDEQRLFYCRTTCGTYPPRRHLPQLACARGRTYQKTTSAST
jgi:hypothetical protein